MRRLAIVSLFGTLTLLGGWWSLRLPKESFVLRSEGQPTTSTEPRPENVGSHAPEAALATAGFIFDGPEIGIARDHLKRVVQTGGYVVDAWRFPQCGGVTVFYRPLDRIEETAWFWYDMAERDFTRMLRLTDLLTALSSHIDNLTFPRGDRHLDPAPTRRTALSRCPWRRRP